MYFINLLKKLNNKYKYILFIKGIFYGTYQYLRYRRYKTDVYKYYVSYYIIWSITNKKPSLKYFKKVIREIQN